MISVDTEINPTKAADREPFIQALQEYLKNPDDQNHFNGQKKLQDTLNTIISNIHFYANNDKFYLSNQLQLGGLIALEAAFVECILSANESLSANAQTSIVDLANKYNSLYNALFAQFTPFGRQVKVYYKEYNEVLSYTKVDGRAKAFQDFKMKLQMMNGLKQRIKDLPNPELPIFFKHTSQKTIEIFLSNIDPFAFAYLREAYKESFKIEHSDPVICIKTAIFCIMTGMIILAPGVLTGVLSYYYFAGVTYQALSAVGVGVLVFSCQAKFIAPNTEMERQDQINKVCSAADALIDNIGDGAQIITEPRNVAKSTNFVRNVVPKIPKYTQTVYKGVEKFFRGKHKNKNIREFLEIRLQKSSLLMNHSTPKDQQNISKFMKENISITKQAKIKKEQTQCII